MGMSTGQLLELKQGKGLEPMGFSNATGSETPNLDFLKSQLAKAEQDIQYWKNMIKSWDDNRNNWSIEYNRLLVLHNKTILGGKKQELADEMVKAQLKMKHAEEQKALAVKEVARFEQEKVTTQKLIDDYQSAVAQSLSQGGTDKGSQQVAELQVERAVQELKSAKSKPIRSILLGIGLIGVLITGIVILRRK